jgi:uncharacterized protein (DUF1697 family)
MQDLKALCEKAGFSKVETYIASGNVVFETKKPAPQAKEVLEKSLKKYAGKPVGVCLRTPGEMAAILAANPFPKAPLNQTVAIFLDAPPPEDALKSLTGVNGEKVELGKREIYVFYGAGMARSKLKIPAAKAGTARNMNTVAKLAGMAAQHAAGK